MGKVVAKKPTIDVHQFVGERVKELQGGMPMSDFAAKSQMRHTVLAGLMKGEPSCLARLESLASRHNKEVSWFFPDGTIPADYPDH